MQKRRVWAPRAGIGLLEILVVVAVLLIVAAILLPIITRAPEGHHRPSCLNNQRQIAVTIQIWVQDHEERYPASSTIWQDITPDKGVLRCPVTKAKDGIDYGYNANLAGLTLTQVTPVAPTLLVTADGGTAQHLLYTAADIAARHQHGYVAGFADGHVEFRKAGSTEQFTVPAKP